MYRVIVKNLDFLVRENTVDLDVVKEVLENDCYNIQNVVLRRKPNVVDIGGHIGSFTKMIATKFPEGKYWIAEANSMNWDILELNLASVLNKTILKGALVGKEPVNKRLVINPAEKDRVTGGWGIMWYEKEYTEVGATLEIEKFYYMKDIYNQVDKVDLLKLDCEGSEWSIVKEMSDEQLYNTDYIVCELHAGALSHAPLTYQEFRKKILKHFICPELERREQVSPNDLFNFIAINRKLS